MQKEYHIDLTQLHEWLPWGGMIYPQVIRNKDRSLMGFISYQGENLSKPENMIDFSDGWAIWSEEQHFNGETRKILTLFWKPFVDYKTGRATNGLAGKPIPVNTIEKSFISTLDNLKNTLFQGGEASILECEEILGYLGSTIRGEAFHMKMLEIPLYLDAILSKDVQFKVFDALTDKKNDLCIDGKFISIMTPLGYPKMPIMGILLRAFRDFDYRFVRRFLFANKHQTKKEMAAYMKDWCYNRKSMKSFLQNGLEGAYNGVYTNTFVFRFNEDEREKNERFIRDVLETMELPHIMEEYNRKHDWWATIPGIHQAGLTSPIKGIESLTELLMTEDKDAKD